MCCTERRKYSWWLPRWLEGVPLVLGLGIACHSPLNPQYSVLRTVKGCQSLIVLTYVQCVIVLSVLQVDRVWKVKN